MKRGRKTKEEIDNIEKARGEVLKRFFGITEKLMKHLEESAEAVKVCDYCNASGDAAKKDEAGKCIKCHGTFKVPDVNQRNWAAEEGFSRIAPKPKPLEMTVDQTSSLPELEKQASKLSDADITKQLEAMNVVFQEEVSEEDTTGTDTESSN